MLSGEACRLVCSSRSSLLIHLLVLACSWTFANTCAAAPSQMRHYGHTYLPVQLEHACALAHTDIQTHRHKHPHDHAFFVRQLLSKCPVCMEGDCMP